MTIAALVAAGPLRMGATGAAVKEIQLALRARGCPLTGTGYFGPQTDTAVEDLQRKSGLPVTGIIDAATAALLDRPSSAASAVPQPARRVVDRILQRLAQHLVADVDVELFILDRAGDRIEAVADRVVDQQLDIGCVER
jgi:peptidoglycan hydrolase-like protein with peptidoglycan-binding domain